MDSSIKREGEVMTIYNVIGWIVLALLLSFVAWVCYNVFGGILFNVAGALIGVSLIVVGAIELIFKK